MKACSIDEVQNTDSPTVFRRKILDWYSVHRRVLPWRPLPGEVRDPYRVWLSEIMLQQTTVPAVIPYFLKFTERWPDVHALAQVDNDEVMSNWAGLGYYARARNLHKCAKIISRDYGGVFPSDQAALKKLPGIGDYTSAAIASIAFNQPATVVDGNVERVMARYHACDIPLPAAKKTLKDYATLYSVGFDNNPGDYAQGLMDLGATICTPKSPVCSLCPLNDGCLGYAGGDLARLPLRMPKQNQPKRHGYVYWVTNKNGDVLLHKRPDKGLLGGMYGLPTSDWPDVECVPEHLDILEAHKAYGEHITHVFTHFYLKLDLCVASVLDAACVSKSYEWFDFKDLENLGMPTVFQKAVRIFK